MTTGVDLSARWFAAERGDGGCGTIDPCRAEGSPGCGEEGAKVNPAAAGPPEDAGQAFEGRCVHGQGAAHNERAAGGAHVIT